MITLCFIYVWNRAPALGTGFHFEIYVGLDLKIDITNVELTPESFNNLIFTAAAVVLTECPVCILFARGHQTNVPVLTEEFA